jgi:hypothetical protein
MYIYVLTARILKFDREMPQKRDHLKYGRWEDGTKMALREIGWGV